MNGVLESDSGKKSRPKCSSVIEIIAQVVAFVLLDEIGTMTPNVPIAPSEGRYEGICIPYCMFITDFCKMNILSQLVGMMHFFLSFVCCIFYMDSDVFLFCNIVLLNGPAPSYCVINPFHPAFQKLLLKSELFTSFRMSKFSSASSFCQK
ncbi:hypothetical protein X975_07911, partial [Stegodyphus mimosarum]